MTHEVCEGPYPDILLRAMSVNTNHRRDPSSTERAVAMTRRTRTIPERSHTTHARECSRIERALARTGRDSIMLEGVHT